MIEENNKQFNTDKIHLTDSERSAIRHALVSHMDAHPFKKVSPYLVFFSIRGLATSSLALFMLVVSGGGTILAAEKALPGQALYFVKRNVSEELFPILLTSERSKAKFAARLIERRLDEAEQLAEHGALTLETRSELEKDMSEHAKDAADIIKDITKETKNDIFEVNDTITLARLEGEVTAKINILTELPVEDSPVLVAVVDPEEAKDDDTKVVVNTDRKSGLQEPHVKSLSKEDTALLGKVALLETEVMKQTLADAREALASTSTDSDEKDKMLKSLADAEARLEVLSEETDELSTTGKARAYRDIISISEEIQTYLANLSQDVAIDSEKAVEETLKSE